MCRDKIKKLNRDLTELRRSHAELQADRDRSLKYNEELEKTLQSMKEINKELKQVDLVFCLFSPQQCGLTNCYVIRRKYHVKMTSLSSMATSRGRDWN